MSIYGTNEPAKPERIDHRPYRFLVSNGVTRFWTHCPICGSCNEGWFEGGEPRYSGGYISVKKDGYDYVLACLCEKGRFLSEKQGMTSVRDVLGKKGFTYNQQPYIIVWRLGDNGQKPPEPEPVPKEVMQEMFSLTERKMMGTITQDQFEAEMRAIESRIPHFQKLPDMRTVLDNENMRKLYLGETNERLPYKED